MLYTCFTSLTNSSSSLVEEETQKRDNPGKTVRIRTDIGSVPKSCMEEVDEALRYNLGLKKL